jgi:hypothetical protein
LLLEKEGKRGVSTKRGSEAAQGETAEALLERELTLATGNSNWEPNKVCWGFFRLGKIVEGGKKFVNP